MDGGREGGKVGDEGMDGILVRYCLSRDGMMHL
jgi:hypothetical protein